MKIDEKGHFHKEESGNPKGRPKAGEAITDWTACPARPWTSKPSSLEAIGVGRYGKRHGPPTLCAIWLKA